MTASTRFSPVLMSVVLPPWLTSRRVCPTSGPVYTRAAPISRGTGVSSFTSARSILCEMNSGCTCTALARLEKPPPSGVRNTTSCGMGTAPFTTCAAVITHCR